MLETAVLKVKTILSPVNPYNVSVVLRVSVKVGIINIGSNISIKRRVLSDEPYIEVYIGQVCQIVNQQGDNVPFASSGDYVDIEVQTVPGKSHPYVLSYFTPQLDAHYNMKLVSLNDLSQLARLISDVRYARLKRRDIKLLNYLLSTTLTQTSTPRYSVPFCSTLSQYPNYYVAPVTYNVEPDENTNNNDGNNDENPEEPSLVSKRTIHV